MEISLYQGTYYKLDIRIGWKKGSNGEFWQKNILISQRLMWEDNIKMDGRQIVRIRTALI
jgi:hypothetical protein